MIVIEVSDGVCFFFCGGEEQEEKNHLAGRIGSVVDGQTTYILLGSFGMMHQKKGAKTLLDNQDSSSSATTPTV